MTHECRVYYTMECIIMKVDCYASRERVQVEGQYGKRMTKRRRGNREHE